MNALERAVETAGSQTELARLVAAQEGHELVKQGHVYKWLNSRRGVPAERCEAVAKAVNYAVTKHDLRPDVFGVAPPAPPPVAAATAAPAGAQPVQHHVAVPAYDFQPDRPDTGFVRPPACDKAA